MGAPNGHFCIVFLPVFVVPDCGVHLRFDLSHSVLLVRLSGRELCSRDPLAS